MDYLQYWRCHNIWSYKCKVLNLIINGLPSIHPEYHTKEDEDYSFKPYYKWITFNT